MQKHALKTQDLRVDLPWIFAQRACPRPFMCGFSALVSLFGHGYPFSHTRRLQTIVLPLHTILGLLGSKSKVHVFQAILFQAVLHTRVTSHLARFPHGSTFLPAALNP